MVVREKRHRQKCAKVEHKADRAALLASAAESAACSPQLLCMLARSGEPVLTAALHCRTLALIGKADNSPSAEMKPLIVPLLDHDSGATRKDLEVGPRRTVLSPLPMTNAVTKCVCANKAKRFGSETVRLL